MNSDTFEALVVEVLNALPPEFARYVANVEVLVAEQPEPEQRRALGLRRGETLYGLYEGVPLTQRTSYDLPMVPDTITIFRAPLVRDFPEPDALRAQIRRTVLHEIAHVFGISDKRLIQLDAY